MEKHTITTMLQKLTVSCRDTMKQESATLHKTHMTTQTNIATTEFTSLTNPLYLLEKCNLIRMESQTTKNTNQNGSVLRKIRLHGEICIVQNNKNGF